MGWFRPVHCKSLLERFITGVCLPVDGRQSDPDPAR
jgi:hypothetical protein